MGVSGGQVNAGLGVDQTPVLSGFTKVAIVNESFGRRVRLVLPGGGINISLLPDNVQNLLAHPDRHHSTFRCR